MTEYLSYIGIGANLGDRVGNCLRALVMLDADPACRVFSTSPWYETEPVGMESSNWFVNAVAGVMTVLGPEALMELLLKIEYELGRQRPEGIDGYVDRIVDLDLLYYEGITTNYGYGDADLLQGGMPNKKQGLVVPHPAIPERRFVLAPWADIAPDLTVEPWGKSVSEMLRGLGTGGPEVRRLRDDAHTWPYPACSLTVHATRWRGEQ